MRPNPTEPNELLAMLGAIALSTKPAPVQTLGEFFGLCAPHGTARPANQFDHVPAPPSPQVSGDSAAFANFALATLATIRRPGYRTGSSAGYAVDRLIDLAGKAVVTL